MKNPAAEAARSLRDQPLRVALMLESDGPGGAEMVLLHLSEGLRARGHMIHPVGPARGVGWLGEQLRSRGFKTETFHLSRPLDLSCLVGMVRMLRRLKVDLIHSHEFTMAVYGAAAAKITRRPHVITMHGSQSMTSAWRRRVALRWAFRHSAAVVAVSESTKQQLEQDLGLARSEISVIRNGVPISRGDPAPVRRELGIGEGEVLILAVGNLDRRKGHMVLLEAVRQLDTEGLEVPWRLVIAGGRGGPERARLEAFAMEHGLAERVHILNQREDVPDLQAAADVFAMPSLWEGLPLALLEAMLAGNAIVASRVSGIPEALSTNEDGLLVKPSDSAALAESLRLLLTDATLRARLAGNARQRALAEFLLETTVATYERLYSSIIGTSATPQASPAPAEPDHSRGDETRQTQERS